MVLRRWDSGESDRRIALLTREHGKIYAVTRGARKANARLAGISEPLTHATFGIALGKSNNYVTQAQPIEGFGHLRMDYQRLLCAFAWLELLDALLQLDEPQPEAFVLSLMGLHGIENAKEPLASLCWADLQLMRIAGFAPEFSCSVESGAALRGEFVYASPSSGGALLTGEAEEITDAVRIPREIAVTISKLQALDTPPNFVKRAQEVGKVLILFLQEITGRELPARKKLLESG